MQAVIAKLLAQRAAPAARCVAMSVEGSRNEARDVLMLKAESMKIETGKERVSTDMAASVSHKHLPLVVPLLPWSARVAGS